MCTVDPFFYCFMQSTSAFDTVQSFKVELGNTIADARRLVGPRMGLKAEHRAYVNGNVVQDDYKPVAGVNVVWKENSKDRGA